MAFRRIGGAPKGSGGATVFGVEGLGHERAKERDAYRTFYRSEPTPDPRLVPDVLLSEDTFQVTLLALDDPAPHDDEDEG